GERPPLRASSEEASPPPARERPLLLRLPVRLLQLQPVPRREPEPHALEHARQRDQNKTKPSAPEARALQLSRPEHQKRLPSPLACVARRLPARRWLLLPAAPMTVRLSSDQLQFRHPHRPMLQLFPSAPAEGPGPDRRTGRRTRRHT